MTLAVVDPACRRRGFRLLPVPAGGFSHNPFEDQAEGFGITVTHLFGNERDGSMQLPG
ncbi:hypothetical protein D3C74_358660 [compost metagenome]